MDLLELLDPELRDAFAAQPASREPFDPVAMREEVRKRLEARAVPPREGILKRDLEVPGPDGNTVPVRVYEPRGRADILPGLLHIHGEIGRAHV